MKGIYILLIGIVGFALTGCYSSNIMQTAKPIENGKVNFTSSARMYWTNDEIPVFPGVSLGLRTGVTNRSDIGFYYSSSIWHNARIDYKHNIWKKADGNSYLSLGLAIENNSLLPDPREFRKSWAASVPLFYSFNHNKPTVVYIAQRFTFGFGDMDLLSNMDYYKNEYQCDSEEFQISHDMIYSGGIGLRWGKKEKFKWFAEFTYSTRFQKFVGCYIDKNDGSSEYYIDDATRLYPEIGIGLSIGNH